MNATVTGDLKLDVEKISAVYSGRLGCACGCRGNHTSNPRSIRLIAKRIEEAAPYPESNRSLTSRPRRKPRPGGGSTHGSPSS